MHNAAIQLDDTIDGTWPPRSLSSHPAEFEAILLEPRKQSPKCSAIIGHRTACTVPPISLTTQFQLSRQQIDDQVQAPQPELMSLVITEQSNC